MLLGCCHCDGEVSSSSSTPSSSASSSGGGGSSNLVYGQCDCAAVPNVWQVIWPTMDANAACPIPAGTYDLTRTVNKTVPGGTPTTYCNWESAQIAPRMKVVTGAWVCETWTPPAFRIMVAPSLWITHVTLFVTHSVWLPGGFGGAYQDHYTRYTNASSPCIHSGLLTTGGSTIVWPNVTDVTFPYTFITMPVPSTVTIRPKV